MLVVAGMTVGVAASSVAVGVLAVWSPVGSVVSVTVVLVCCVGR